MNKLLKYLILFLLINSIQIYSQEKSTKTMKEFYKDCPVLITGGAGFIGSHIAEKLTNLGAKVTIIDNLSSGKIENIDAIKNQINFIQGDISDFNVCLNATKNQKIIFHLAAIVSVIESMEKPEECNKVNILGIFNLLEAARINKVDSFIFSSSSAVYGKTQEVCKESFACNPISVYGYSKLIGEQYCQLYTNLFGLNTICLRYFNVFGPRQNPHGEYSGVIAKFTDNIRNNKPITIYGDGKQTRDFVPVQKIVDANTILAMLPKKELNGQPVNIATGKSITLLDLVNNLKTQFPKYSLDPIFLAARPGDIIFSFADCSKYQSLISKLYI